MKTLLKWSVEDYHNMIDAGILCDRNVELLAGEIIKMSPESPSDYYTVKQGTKYLETFIQEYWFLDLSPKQLIVFRDPKNHIYLSQQIIDQGNINP